MVGADVHKQTPASVILQVTVNKPMQGHHTLTRYLVEARDMLAKTKGAYQESSNAQLYGMGLSQMCTAKCGRTWKKLMHLHMARNEHENCCIHQVVALTTPESEVPELTAMASRKKDHTNLLPLNYLVHETMHAYNKRACTSKIDGGGSFGGNMAWTGLC